MTPVTVASGLSWPRHKAARTGPFEYGSDLYGVFHSGTALGLYKSTDDGATWSLDTSIATLIASGEYYDAQYRGTTVYVAHLTSAGNSTNVWRKDLSTGTVTNVTGGPDTALTHVSSAPPIFLAVRSDGDFILFHQLSTQSVMGSPYRRCGYSRYESGAWTLNTNVDGIGSVATHADARMIAIDSSDRTYLFFEDSSNGQRVKVLSSANALSTVFNSGPAASQSGVNYNVGHAVMDTSGTESVVLTMYGNDTGSIDNNLVMMRYPAASPVASKTQVNVSTTNDPEVTTSNPSSIVMDGATIHVFWPDASTDDLWHDSGTVAGGFSTDEEIQDAVTIQGISARKLTSGIGYFFSDNGTVKYDTYGATPPQPTEITYRSTTTATSGTVNKPTSTDVGDTLVAEVLAAHSSAAAISGFTVQASTTYGGTITFTMLTRQVDGTEGATFTATGGTLYGVQMHRYSGVDPASTVSGTPTATNAIATTASPASITTLVPETVLVLGGAAYISGGTSADGFTWSGSMTERSDAAGVAATLRLGAADEAVAAAGATGTRTVTNAHTGGTAITLAAMLALKPIPPEPVSLTLTGAVTGTSTVSGSLKATKKITGAVTGTSTVSGAIKKRMTLSGSVVGTSSVSGNVTKALKLSGTATGTSSVTGSAKLIVKAAGAITGTSSVTGSVKLAKKLTGAITGTSTVTGAAKLRKSLTGAVAGTSLVSGAAKLRKTLAGAITGTSTTAGAAKLLKRLTGSATGTSTVTGNVESEFTGGILLTLSGSITGTSSVSGSAKLRKTLTGAVTGTSSTAGAAKLRKSLAGAILGSSTATGNVRVIIKLNGSAVGTSSVSGDLQILSLAALGGILRTHPGPWMTATREPGTHDLIIARTPTLIALSLLREPGIADLAVSRDTTVDTMGINRSTPDAPLGINRTKGD